MKIKDFQTSEFCFFGCRLDLLRKPQNSKEGMFIKMATGIIIALLIAICITAIKSYLKKLAHGCCGAGGDDEKTV